MAPTRQDLDGTAAKRCQNGAKSLDRRCSPRYGTPACLNKPKGGHLSSRRTLHAWCTCALFAAVAVFPGAVVAQERGDRDAVQARREAPPGSYGSYADTPSALDELLDRTFRIDIRSIAVVFDYYPEQSRVDAVARVDFVMRPGQTVPRFHFSALADGTATVSALVLDGEAMTLPGSSVSLVPVEGSSQKIYEINRSLSPGATHSLVMTYSLGLSKAYPRFMTEVNDMQGSGNEKLYPTLNTPHELARHRFAFHVHGSSEYRCIGSGLVLRQDDPQEADVQQWVQDSEREVASYTMMFVLMPASDTDLQERMIGGIPVRILARRSGPSIASAFAVLEDWLPRLQATFGPYPAPRGLSVFLVTTYGGMEFFGGVLTSPGPLTHEVLHNYFGCAVVMRTYRDSALDESITQWYDTVAHGTPFSTTPDTYRSNFIGARSPVSVGYSRLAYSDGGGMMQALANRLGGVDRMAAFLRYVYERHAFTPFTIMDFVIWFRDYSGIDMKSQFELWLYNGVAQATAGSSAPQPSGAGSPGDRPVTSPGSEGR